MSEQHQLHIGIVEDNADLLENLEFFLRAKGHIVWSARNAEAFCRQLSVTRTEVALIDLVLPRADGLSVLKQMRATNPSCALIMLSARGDVDSRLAAIQAGADHYFVKPVDLRELALVIDTVWRRIHTVPIEASSPLVASAQTTEVTEKWHLDPLKRALKSHRGLTLPLSDTENRLVALLCSAPYQLHTKDQILSAVYIAEDAGDFHRVEVLLTRLRQKARGLNIVLPIRSVFGKGLVFTEDCTIQS